MPNQPIIVRAMSIVAGLALQVDGYLSHEHELTTRTGGEPLEDGREVTDHVVAAPQKVILTGQASDMRGGSRAKDAWQAIEELHKAAEPVRVITEWGSYNEMVIARCKGQSVGRGLRFEMELREILRVGSAMGGGTPGSAMAGNAAGRSGEVSRGRVPVGSIFDVL